MNQVLLNRVPLASFFLALFTAGSAVSVSSSQYLDNLLDIWTPHKERGRWREYNSTNFEKIKPACLTQIDTYLKALERGESWAVQVSDATGRYSGGLLSGNDFALGSRALCQDVDRRSQKNETGAPFRVGFFTVSTSIRTSFTSSLTSHSFFFGFCLPRVCSVDDLTTLFHSTRVIRSNLTNIRVRSVTENYQYWTDPKFSLLLWVCVAIGTLMLTGTCYDKLVYQPAISKCSDNLMGAPKNEINAQKAFNGGCVSMKQEQLQGIVSEINARKVTALPIDFNEGFQIKNDPSILKQIGGTPLQRIRFLKRSALCHKVHSVVSEILLAFSVPRNVAKIGSLEVGDDTLAPLHGLRFISMLWVILVHTCLLVFQASDNKSFRSKVEDNFLFQTVSSGTFSVDTFFFISGSLVSFLYFRTCSKFTLKEMTNMDGEFQGQVVQFFTMLAYRFIRLTPPYLIMIWIVELQMKHFRDHAVLEFPSLDHVNCPKYWWRNIIYINTLFPGKERCVIWSWYLADDTQFFVIGILLLLVAIKYFKVAASAVTVLLCASWVITATITINANYIPSFKDPFAQYDAIYEKPWTRLGPYLVGMATGWFLFKKKDTFSPSKTMVRIGWSITLFVLLSLIYGLYYVKLGPITAAAYVALSHTAWAFALGWILIMCMIGEAGFVNRVLSFKYIYPLSRITYCAYLIHPQIMRSTVLTSDATTHISIQGTTTMFLGFVLLSYVLAFGMSLTFEAPFVSLLKVAHPTRRKPR